MSCVPMSVRCRNLAVANGMSPPSDGDGDAADLKNASSRDRYSFVGEDSLSPSSNSPDVYFSSRSQMKSILHTSRGSHRSLMSKSRLSKASSNRSHGRTTLISRSSEMVKETNSIAASSQTRSTDSDSLESAHNLVYDERQDRVDAVVTLGRNICSAEKRAPSAGQSVFEEEDESSRGAPTKTFICGKPSISGPEKTNNISERGLTNNTVVRKELMWTSFQESDQETIQQRLLIREIDASFLPYMDRMLADYDEMATCLMEENKRLKELLQGEGVEVDQHIEQPTNSCVSGASVRKSVSELTNNELVSIIEGLELEKANVKRESKVKIERLQKELAATNNRYIDAKSMLHENAKLLVAARDFITSQQKLGSGPTSPASSAMSNDTEKDIIITDLVNEISGMQREENRKNEAVLNCLHEVMVFLFQKSPDHKKDATKLIATVQETSKMFTTQMIE